MTPDRPSTAVRRFVLVAILLPAVLTLVSIVVQLLALPQVPATIAVHWGPAGDADGFGPAGIQPLLTAVVGYGVPLLLALACLPGLRRGDRGPAYRLLGAMAAGISALAAVLFGWTLLAQRGLGDAADAPSVLPGMLAALVAAAVVGVAAWFAQPAETAHNVTAVPASGISLALGERAAWFGTTALGRTGCIVIGAACVLVAGSALAVWFSGAPVGIALVLGGVALLLTILAFTTAVFHVRVDESGLTVVSPLGFPRFHVPLSDIRGVAVGDVSPLGEFGGYGIRSNVGAFGVVLRRGPALTVTRGSGRRFVVTVDDAARGGALLEALAQRSGAVEG